MKAVWNEDNDLMSCLQPGNAADQMRENLTWTMDRVPIDIYELHCATPDVCFFDSKAGEVLGRRILAEAQEHACQHPYDLPGPKPGRLHHHIAAVSELLRKEGTDSLDVHVECAHERGVKLVGEMRMGDTHQPELDLANPLVPQFAVDHPEYVIKRADGITPVALDYGFEEVREHRLAILREIVEDHDADGLSLNFMRWGKYFDRDFGREKTPIMTEFVGRIHAMLNEVADARGKDHLILGVRALSTIDESLGAGLDVAAWMKRGYLDYAIASEFNNSWPGLNVEQFVAAAEGTGCEVYGMMGDMIGSGWAGKPEPEDRGLARAAKRTGYQCMLNTPEEARATAANLYAWGAKGIGFWNMPNNFNMWGHGECGQFPEQRERILSWMLEAIDPERVRAGRRRYHYIPLYKRNFVGVKRNYKYLESWRSPHGAFKASTIYFNEGMQGVRQVFPFRMADGRDGEKLRGTFRFRMIHCTDEDAFGLDINGAPVPADKIRRTVDTTDPEMCWTWVEMDLAECPAFRGDNELGITWRSEADHALTVPYMEELDVTVEA